jgi:hypothetical protein
MPWHPRFSQEEWVYTAGSDIKGHPRLGAVVVHIPTRITIYIDAAGSEETRTIMRAELVAIHTALTRFEEHAWLGVFTNSLSSLQAIRLHYYKPGLTIAPHYHHHMLLLQSISHLLETRRERGYCTKSHTHICGNDLVDAAAKLAVTDYDTLPHEHTMRVEIGAIAPRPPFCVMYTAIPLTPSPALATRPRRATLRPPWWIVPEGDRLQMPAFTRSSQQLREKVRAATLRSMLHTSIYKGLILQARTQGATTATTGTALHARLRENSKEGTNLLKFSHGHLYNGKLAKRYGHATTDESLLCHRPDSFTHIAGECKAHKIPRSAVITRHVSSHTRQYAAPQRGAAHYTKQMTYV